MNETTGLPSGTIHRLLGLNGREKAPSISPKELEGGLLIVDEMSMVDTWLANTLFKSIPTNMQVIFVGDKDQLPSVGPGQVLHDLLAIDAIPKQELTEIYRQGDGSSIIPLAHAIKNGQLPADFTQNQKDRSFFACDAYKIEPLIAQIVKRAKDKGYTPQDIQVLAPMYRGAAGIDALNKMMQEIFNPNDGTKKEVTFNDTVYRIGDKVLQLVNSPEDNVFNGDMGQIVGITLAKQSEDKVDELVIQFDANEVTYKRIGYEEYRRNKISLIFQSYNLIPYLTALENVLVSMAISDNKLPDQHDQIAYRLLDYIGINSTKADRFVNQLSGGEQQRVAIARALATNVDIILADEPTGNLDEGMEQEIVYIFKELAAIHNKCIIVVTHSTEIAKQSDQTFYLKKGALTAYE